jgi:hypothetical protein
MYWLCINNFNGGFIPPTREAGAGERIKFNNGWFFKEKS